MRKLSLLFLTAMIAGSAQAQQQPDNLVLVEGGAFRNTKSNFYGKHVTLPSFYIGKCEVTQREWLAVMGSNPSKFRGENLPVDTVSWYDCIEYCNKRSLSAGLMPCYTIDKSRQDPNNLTAIDDVKWIVTIRAGANGYRLPTEAEWEYAADGGQKTKNYTYSGSDTVDNVAWFWQNSGDKVLTGQWIWAVVESNHDRTRPIGGKDSNELGLFDMSGNAREWCWEWFGNLDGNGVGTKASTSESGRVWKGGGWLGGDFCCASSFRASFEASGSGPDQGLRVCRNK